MRAEGGGYFPRLVSVIYGPSAWNAVYSTDGREARPSLHVGVCQAEVNASLNLTRDPPLIADERQEAAAVRREG